MNITSHNFTPFIPSDEVLEKSALPDLAMSLDRADGQLAGRLVDTTKKTISQHMVIINSYYSNLIEGNHTLPHEIRAAQRGEYDEDPLKRDLQKESVAHIHVQNWIKDQSPDRDMIYSPAFLKAIHREFYNQLPEHMWEIKDKDGKVKGKVVPGEWRNQSVEVGRHIPPDDKSLNTLMEQFCQIYHPDKFVGQKKIIAVMCAHHRFVWIHPFHDGNGRVVRLFTDTALSSLGLNGIGVWCLSRGLARTSKDYKASLARADFSRQGIQDGRGLLSQNNLLEFCEYMLKTAIDQVEYISGLLELQKMLNRITGYIQARNDDRVTGISDDISEKAILILYNAFINGELKRSMAYDLCASGKSDRTDRRLLEQLKKEGLLTESSSRSPFRWAIPEHAEPWYFPELVPGTM
ncbi:MAG: Fic family protein [Gammaproteobacteria bacterium]|nr:MAG: Fic family protein [Gammaproteobacteria bacterium]